MVFVKKKNKNIDKKNESIVSSKKYTGDSSEINSSEIESGDRYFIEKKSKKMEI